MGRPPLGTEGYSEGHTEDIQGTSMRKRSRWRGPVGSDVTGPPPHVILTVRSIRQTQKFIRQRIKQIENQLKGLAKRDVPDTQPWISFERVGSIKDLRGKFYSLRQALENDLKVLREELRRLSGEAQKARNAQLHRKARSSSLKFEKDLERLLREAEKIGSLDFSEIEQIRTNSGKALRDWIKAVDQDPSPKNIVGLLSQLEGSYTVGLGSDSGHVGDAWRALKDAAGKRKRAVEADFRANPTRKNLDHLVETIIESQQLGGKELPGEIPSNLRRVRSDKVYTVVPGDTLSGISTRFYGSPAFWDIIYFQNINVIGNDPDRIPPGIELKIP